jgi:acyl-CoA dehydrogenase
MHPTTPRVAELVERTRTLVETTVLPLEKTFDGDIERAGGDRLRHELQESAREAGVFAPHASVEHGGHGLGMVDRAPVFEAAGYSVFGALALNIAAPDEGNVHLLQEVATPEQRERYLGPLARGEVRSAFAMTEPSPGAGSDPSMLATQARRDGDEWVIDGDKRFITGADGAGFFIVMARTSPGDGGATMFLVPGDDPGATVGRHITTMDRSMVGGHCEVSFRGVRVGDDAVLGEVDRGFVNAQVRLGPARMTHVMRWLGAARQAHECALGYVQERHAFGSRLGDLGLAQQLIADSEIDLAATRALLLTACAALDRGERASHETSIAKTFGAEAICRVVDRAMQLTGGTGVSDDLPIARLYREVRPFRVYDGPSEVHRWSIARRALRRHQAPA